MKDKSINIIKHFPFNPQPHHLSVLFPTGEWISKEKMWINLQPQGTKGWLESRKGNIPIYFLKQNEPTLLSIKDLCVSTRITGSKFGVAAGHAPSSFSTPTELAQQIAGLKEVYFDKASQERMNHGTMQEPNARNWYEISHGVEVEEVGLVVPKWNFHLGASVDGIVKGTEGIIEIKCPKRMYRPLKEHLLLRKTGWIPKTQFFRSHIWTTHYDQMQGGMAILDKKWCDYIVYATDDEEVYCERILFNKRYWENVLYPKLQLFLSNELFPLLEEIISNKV